MNKKELIEKAMALGIELKGNETVAVLNELIAKSIVNGSEELVVNASEAEMPEDPIEDVSEPTEGTISEEEIAKQRVDALEQLKTEAVESIPVDEVRVMLNNIRQEFEAKLKAQKEGIDPSKIFEPDFKMKRKYRIARLNNKFVVGFKNLHNDPYVPNGEKYVVNILNKGLERPQMEPWVMLQFHDGSEEFYPLFAFMNNATAVYFEEVSKRDIDQSKSFGLVERTVESEDGWSRKGTGQYINAKHTKVRTVYTVTDNKGHTLEVQPEVINLIQAPIDYQANVIN